MGGSHSPSMSSSQSSGFLASGSGMVSGLSQSWNKTATTIINNSISLHVYPKKGIGLYLNSGTNRSTFTPSGHEVYSLIYF